MTRFSKSAVTRASDSASILSNTAASVKTVINTLSRKIDESESTLIGKGYDAARKKLRLYLSAYQYEYDLLDYAKDNLININNKALNFLENYDELDDEELDTIEYTYITTKNNLNFLESSLESLQNSFLVNNKAAEMISLSNRIEQLQIYLNDLNKKIAKLEELEDFDDRLRSELSETNRTVSNFKRAVEDITPSNSYNTSSL